MPASGCTASQHARVFPVDEPPTGTAIRLRPAATSRTARPAPGHARALRNSATPMPPRHHCREQHRPARPDELPRCAAPTPRSDGPAPTAPRLEPRPAATPATPRQAASKRGPAPRRSAPRALGREPETLTRWCAPAPTRRGSSVLLILLRAGPALNFARRSARAGLSPLSIRSSCTCFAPRNAVFAGVRLPPANPGEHRLRDLRSRHPINLELAVTVAVVILTAALVIVIALLAAAGAAKCTPERRHLPSRHHPSRHRLRSGHHPRCRGGRSLAALLT